MSECCELASILANSVGGWSSRLLCGLTSLYDPPAVDAQLRIQQRGDVVLVQALVAEFDVEAFDEGVLNRSPWPNEVQSEAATVAESSQGRGPTRA